MRCFATERFFRGTAPAYVKRVIVYFDTSALVKRYLVEADSPIIEALWNKATRAVASEILYDEMVATFARKKREVPRRRREQPMTFACADAKLVAAARAEGLEIEP